MIDDVAFYESNHIICRRFHITVEFDEVIISSDIRELINLFQLVTEVSHLHSAEICGMSIYPIKNNELVQTPRCNVLLYSVIEQVITIVFLYNIRIEFTIYLIEFMNRQFAVHIKSNFCDTIRIVRRESEITHFSEV